MFEVRLILLIGVFLFGIWRIFACGEDWYDVWFAGPHYSWFSGFGNYIFGTIVISSVVLVLAAVSAGLPGRATPYPTYEESTPIKTSSKKPAQHRKLHSKSWKATAKRRVKVRAGASTQQSVLAE